ncbi:hypothetical protein BDV06DRAFT_200737 [Aspergillus oleicola]
MSITMLSVELVTIVCSYLDRSEWAALRLTCSWLYSASLDAFASQYFESIRFIATGNGIRELEALSLSEIIRGRVREIWMIPSVFQGHHDMDLFRFRMSPFANSPKSGESLGDKELRARYGKYRAMVADNRTFLESEDLGTRLRKCLARFDNLESVGLKPYPTTFLVDPQQHEVSCLGVRHLKDQLEFTFQPIHSSHSSIMSSASAKANSLAVSKLFQALGGCNQKLKRLHTCGLEFCDSILSELPVSQAEVDCLLLTLVDLEDLHICVSYDELTPKKNATSMNAIGLLLAVAPSLKALAFSQLDRDQATMKYNYFLDVAQSIKFTQLKSLHLHWIEIQLPSLKSFLHTAKATLKTLTLDFVSMNDDPLPKRDRKSRRHKLATVEVLWQRVWRYLGDELSLKTYSMGNLAHRELRVFMREYAEGAQETAFAHFDKKELGISFHEWIGRFEAVVIPTSYVLNDTSRWSRQGEFSIKVISARLCHLIKLL